MFHRILVGIDDSDAAKGALQQAIELVEAGHGRLGLLSAAPKPPPLACAAPVVLPMSRVELERELLEWAERNVEEAARLVPEDIPVTKLVKRGRPGSALLAEARTGCWDLVIVGQAERRFRPLFARVGEWLNQRSPTAVLVVHEQPEAARPASGGRRRGVQVRTA
jgi:nucleotide-binding universal stress UspA family protein